MFIVIEGIDGAGCETQGKNLMNLLQKNEKKASLIRYPDYQRNAGSLIKEFLYQNKDLDAREQFLLYTLQFIFDKKMIAEKRKKEVLIADRYFTTTLCYQTLEGFPLDFALEYAKIFKIEKPDLVFYLDVDPETAIARKKGEDKEKNRREKDFEFIKKTYKNYQYLIRNKVWARWVIIDGKKNIDEVTKEIYNQIINFKT